MNDEEVIFSLIKQGCQKGGHAKSTQLEKMASLLNIHPTKYQKILEAMIEEKRVQKKGEALVLL